MMCVHLYAHAHMHVHTYVEALEPHGIGSQKLELQAVVSHLNGCLKIDLGLLEKQCLFLLEKQCLFLTSKHLRSPSRVDFLICHRFTMH